jgi:hypothetical protein
VSSTIQASFRRLKSLQRLLLFATQEDIDYGTQFCTSSGSVCPWASHSSRTCAAPVSHYRDLCSQYLPHLPLEKTSGPVKSSLEGASFWTDCCHLLPLSMGFMLVTGQTLICSAEKGTSEEDFLTAPPACGSTVFAFGKPSALTGLQS